MIDLLKITHGKVISNIFPIFSEISDDIKKLQIIFTDDTEMIISIDGTSLDWLLK